MSDDLKKIDHSAIRVSQVSLVALNIAAFVMDAPWLVILVAGFMILGVALGIPAFGFVYRWGLKPAGFVKPDILMDNPEPHRFAQALGGLFMAAGALALWSGAAFIGWGLVWVVAGLAALNAFGGFCVGCMVYYWLSRMNVPGFRKSPPPGTLPGLRPKTQVIHES